MTINRNNYEEFFLDYMDRTLEPQQVATLLLFLEQNHDLKEEFETMEPIGLDREEEIKFSLKDSLKKEDPTNLINSNNYSEFIIASIEGDLNKNGNTSLQHYISNNTNAAKDYTIFNNTKLVPDLAVIFKNKQQLKHRSIATSRPIYYFVAAAASVAILLGLFFFLNQSGTKEQGERYAQKITTIKTKESNLNKLTEKEKTQIAFTTESPNKSGYANKIIESIDDKNNVIEKESIEPINNIKVQYIAENKKSTVPKLLVELPEITRLNNKNEDLADAAPKKNNAVYYTLSKLFNNSVKGVLKDNNFGGELASYRKKLNFYELAYWSTQGYNKVFHKNIGIDREYDNTGDLVAFNVKAESVEFSKKFDK